MKAKKTAPFVFLVLALAGNLFWLEPSSARASGCRPLVDAAWLADHRGEAGIKVLEVGSLYARLSWLKFVAGHIRGAVYTDYRGDNWRTIDAAGVIDQLPPLDSLTALIGGLGIAADDEVVIAAVENSEYAIGAAARVFWTFRVLGQRKLHLLDGGVPAYMALPGADSEAGAGSHTTATYRASPDMSLRATAADVSALRNRPGGLVDYRSPGEFQGRQKILLSGRRGTIPGARSLHVAKLIDGQGRLLPVAALRTLFEARKVSLSAPLIAFCTTGHRAALGWFVSYELLGDRATRLYDGSMVDWSLDPSRPVVPGHMTQSPE